jgi:nitrogen regulatory protein PII-like uncharacterized protein
MLSILLSGVLGLFTSFLPELLKFFTQKRDQEQEIKILQMQTDREVKMAELGHVQKMEEINTEADIKESEALYKNAEVKITGIKFIDGILAFLNGSVRPVVTYLFVFFYIGIKMAQYHSMSIQNIPWDKGVMLLWAEFDCAILMLCLSYFFGARMASKVFKLK